MDLCQLGRITPHLGQAEALSAILLRSQIPTFNFFFHFILQTEEIFSLVVAGGVIVRGGGGVTTLHNIYIYALDHGNITLHNRGKGIQFDIKSSGSTIYDGRLYVVGSRAHKYRGRATVFNFHNNTWDNLPDLHEKAYRPPVVFVHQNILFALHDAKVQTLDLSNIHCEWEMNGVSPDIFEGHNSVVKTGEQVYIIGKAGMHRDFSTAFFMLNWSSSTTPRWNRGKNMVVPRHPEGLCALTDSDKNIWVLGGCKNCWNDGFIEMYNMSSDSWVKVNSSMPNVGAKYSNSIGVHICGYAQRFIYMIFADNRGLNQIWGTGYQYEEYDARFYVYNIAQNTLRKIDHRSCNNHIFLD